MREPTIKRISCLFNKYLKAKKIPKSNSGQVLQVQLRVVSFKITKR